MGAVDADHQAGVQDHQTVGGHWIPGGRPQDGLQRNGHAGADQPRVSSHEHEHLSINNLGGAVFVTSSHHHHQPPYDFHHIVTIHKRGEKKYNNSDCEKVVGKR